MNGPHDLGGAHGFGPVIVTAQEPVFDRGWERRVFGMSFALWGRIAGVDEFRYARERMAPVAYLGASYYEKWVAAWETLLVERGVLTEEELEDRLNALREHPDVSMPHRRDPGLAKDIMDTVRRGVSAQEDVARQPRFAEGDAVMARNWHPVGHTRLPRYVRGRSGVVRRLLGGFCLPDARASGEGKRAEHCYTVAFDARQLWGDSAEPQTSVWLDLWESYLVPLGERGNDD